MAQADTYDFRADFDFTPGDFGGGEGLDFDIADFSLVADDEKNRYLKPSVHVVDEKRIFYDNARKLAKQTAIGKGERIHAIVSGNFIFGDFIEAYIVHHNAKVPKMTISTLSLSQDNVDSLHNLLVGGFVDKLNIIVSAYFFSHEKQGLIPYIYKTLDTDNRLQLAVAGVHTKVVNFTTTGGKYIVMHGSANLRSSGNVEQFTIEENRELYDFYDRFHDRILKKHATIRKSIRRSELWETIAGEKQAKTDENRIKTDKN
jgi:hypothetical protein